MGDASNRQISNGVGFATLKPKFSDASAQLVELMRATLRQAQEISVAVGEAEGTAEKARAAVATTMDATTEAESRIAEAEIAKLTLKLSGTSDAPSVAGGDKLRPAILSTSMASSVNLASSANLTNLAASANIGASLAPSPVAVHDAVASEEGVLSGSANSADLQDTSGNGAVTALDVSGNSGMIPGGGGTKSAAVQMSQEIETTVMWVQQLLESVHFIESDTALEPGASLLSIVQPRLRHQKDEALNQSMKHFNEKKEAEKEVDERAAFFRRQALQAAIAQRNAA